MARRSTRPGSGLRERTAGAARGSARTPSRQLVRTDARNVRAQPARLSSGNTAGLTVPELLASPCELRANPQRRRPSLPCASADKNSISRGLGKNLVLLLAECALLRLVVLAPLALRAPGTLNAARGASMTSRRARRRVRRLRCLAEHAPPPQAEPGFPELPLS